MTGYKLIFFLCCSFFMQAAYSQETSPPVKEKMYAHTDKTVYVAGEILWFKLYDVNAVTHRLSGLSKIAYVELIDSVNKQVAGVKIALRNGLGKGSFLLSPSVSSGSYKMRAYTAWMKNGSPDDFFQKDITLINVQKLAVNKREKADDANSFSVQPDDAVFTNSRQPDSDTLSLTLTSEKPD